MRLAREAGLPPARGMQPSGCEGSPGSPAARMELVPGVHDRTQMFLAAVDCAPGSAGQTRAISCCHIGTGSAGAACVAAASKN